MGEHAKQARFRWRPRQVLGLVTKTTQEWAEDKAPKQAAALAYYALFALGPILLIATAVAGLAFGQAAARDAVAQQIGKLVGEGAAEAVQALMAGGLRGGAGVVGLVLGGIALLFGAAGVFGQLREALNRVWEVEEKAVQGWKNKLVTAVRKNFLGFAGVLGVGFLLLMSLLLGAAVQAVATYAQGVLPGGPILWGIVNILLSVGLVAGLFALMYKYLPNARVAWHDVWVGAICTSVLLAIGEFAIGFYLGHGSVATRYGGAGALLIVLLWVYYSSLILFFGAELTQVYANTYGTHIRPSRDGETLQQGIAKRESPPDVEGTEAKPGKQPRHAAKRSPRPGHAAARPRRTSRPVAARPHASKTVSR
ncbi:MAG TPA: YihY/virulence factor BrkB family protein [Candidatus Thermoplasmatota archaeon]|nr:YihY/virulence factor BrkB family protein [Candidatus Thermoplasmatota archaeon]